MGVKVIGVVDFVARENWPQFLSSARWLTGCWANTPYKLAISVPMLTNGEAFAPGLAGANDNAFAQLGRMLVATGKADAYIRLGWEFNGGWYPWRVSRDPASFRTLFRHIVGVLRKTPGQHFKIVWNPSMNTGTIAPNDAWPGDDVVDVIGLDVYNQSWNPADIIPALRWQHHQTANYGLGWLAKFAATHRKPIAIPEWGTGTRPDGHGWGDDPAFIHNMAAWMRDHRVLFHGYWDFMASDFTGQLSTDLSPYAKAAYTREFGH
jgi:hypothetical protein